jgi:hypothetical protein
MPVSVAAVANGSRTPSSSRYGGQIGACGSGVSAAVPYAAFGQGWPVSQGRGERSLGLPSPSMESSPRQRVFQRHPVQAPGRGVQAMVLPSKVAVPCVAARRPLPQCEQGQLRHDADRCERWSRTWNRWPNTRPVDVPPVSGYPSTPSTGSPCRVQSEPTRARRAWGLGGEISRKRPSSSGPSPARRSVQSRLGTGTGDRS